MRGSLSLLAAALVVLSTVISRTCAFGFGFLPASRLSVARRSRWVNVRVAKHALKATIEENLAAQVSADIISPPATSASENFAFHVGDIYNATVTSAFKLGVYVELDGSKQQVLLSRLLLSFAQYRNMSEEIGDAVQIVLTEIDHENRTLSGTLVGNPTTPPPDLPMSTSRGTSLQTREPRVKRDLSVLAKADSSKIYKGKTVGCQDFGVFVELDEYPGAQGVLPFKFVPGRFLNDLKVNYTPNKEIDVMIYDVDVASGRLTLSMMQERRKDLSEFENFNSSDVWPGVISEIVPYGIIVNLKDKDVGGLVHRSDMPDIDDTDDLNESFKVGQNVSVSIVDVNMMTRQLSFELSYTFEDLVANAKAEKEEYRAKKLASMNRRNRGDEDEDEEVEEERLRVLMEVLELEEEMEDPMDIRREMEEEIEEDMREKEERLAERTSFEARTNEREIPWPSALSIPKMKMPTMLSCTPYEILQDLVKDKKIEDIPESERVRSIVPYLLKGEALPDWALFNEEEIDIETPYPVTPDVPLKAVERKRSVSTATTTDEDDDDDDGDDDEEESIVGEEEEEEEEEGFVGEEEEESFVGEEEKEQSIVGDEAEDA